MQHPVDIIPQYESGDRNVMNYINDPTHTAQGNWQITNTNWKAYAPRAGIDLAQFPDAMSAPRDLQRSVAIKMYDEQGYKPWAPYNDKLQAALSDGSQAGVGYIKPVSPLEPQYATKSGVTYPGSSDPNAIGVGSIGASFIPKADTAEAPASIAGETEAPRGSPVVVANLPNYGLGQAFAQALGSLTPKAQPYTTAPLQGGVRPSSLGNGAPRSQPPIIV
jgi:hypothetical protein